MDGVDEVVATIIDTEDPDEAHRLEAELVGQTDNGWHEGDPLDQPDNPEAPWHADDLAGPAGVEAAPAPARGPARAPGVPGADDLVAQAERWVGFVEGPRNDAPPFGGWYGMNHQPYCAMAFSRWCFDAGAPQPASTAKGFASVAAGREWYQRKGRFVSEPRRGYAVFFTFSHIGLVTGVGPGWVDTIEANTSRGSAGSQRDGGGVWRRRRGMKIIRGFGVPVGLRFDGADGGPAQREEEMAYTTIPPSGDQAIPLPTSDGSWHWSMVCDFDPTRVRFAVGGNGKWRRIEEVELAPGVPLSDAVHTGDSVLSVANSGPRAVGVLLHRR